MPPVKSSYQHRGASSACAPVTTDGTSSKASPTRTRVAALMRRSAGSEVLTRVGDGVDRAARLVALRAGDERADVDDPLALLARDAGPVVRVGGVGQVL